jgi:hypothetical protein
MQGVGAHMSMLTGTLASFHHLAETSEPGSAFTATFGTVQYGECCQLRPVLLNSTCVSRPQPEPWDAKAMDSHKHAPVHVLRERASWLVSQRPPRLTTLALTAPRCCRSCFVLSHLALVDSSRSA